MIRKIKNILSSLYSKYFLDELHYNKALIAKMLVNINNNKDILFLEESEFKVSSQFGEDGIIQYLISKIPIENKVFVEFGVENYTESNTRFLLQNNNWSGLVIDGNIRNISYIKKDPIFWKYDLVAKHTFVDVDNINTLLRDYIQQSNFSKDIGLLSIDIDGNDYHIWQAIDAISPIIVICEYNALLGDEISVTVPYDPSFVRSKKHYSNLYFGASLKALCDLANKKGYAFIGTNSSGNNAFFVRNDHADKYINRLIANPKDGYNQSKFKESRAFSGELTFLRGKAKLAEIKDLEFVDLNCNKICKFKDLSKDL